MKVKFAAGSNIAMKVPSHEYEETVSFYRDTLGFEVLGPNPPGEVEATCFRFGAAKLWIDRIPGLSQAEIWLQVETDDIEAAADYLEERACPRRDEIEPLPASMNGFWISNPANVIHLVVREDAD